MSAINHKNKINQKSVTLELDSSKLIEEAIRHEWATIKLLKIWTPEKFAVIILKFEQGGFTLE